MFIAFLSFWVKGKPYRGVSDGKIRNSDGGFLYWLSIVTIALPISNHSAAISNLPSNVSDAHGSFGGMGRKELTNVSHSLTQSRRDMRAVVCKRNLVYIFCRLSAMHERERQTDTQTRRQTTKR